MSTAVRALSPHSIGRGRKISIVVDPPEDRVVSDVGIKLKSLRELVGLSQLEVAFLCRVDVSTISRWERGRTAHRHKSKDRQIRTALQALEWAAELQAMEPNRVFERDEVFDYIQGRLAEQRKGSGRL